MSRSPPPLKTYSHLATEARVPSEYEIVTSRLLYHPSRGFEIDLPLSAFYERYQKGGRLACSDWDTFADPRQTTSSPTTRMRPRNEGMISSRSPGREKGAPARRLTSLAIRRHLPATSTRR